MAITLPPAILEMPASPPPKGSVSTADTHESREREVLIASGICLFLVLLSMGLRVYAKWKILPRFLIDDLTCGLAIFACTGFICISIATAANGPYGHHIWNVKIGDFTTEKLVFTLIGEILCGPCFWFIKLALFIFYLRIFRVVGWLRYCVYAGIAVTGALYMLTCVLFAVLCAPSGGQTQSAYLLAISNAKCIKARDMAMVIGCINVLSDLYILGLPLPIVWATNLPLRKKLGVATMFSTGLIAVIASSLALVYRVRQNRSRDQTWATIPVYITTILEMTAGVSVCCMPTTAAVFNHHKAPFMAFISNTSRSLLLKRSNGARDDPVDSKNRCVVQNVSAEPQKFGVTDIPEYKLSTPVKGFDVDIESCTTTEEE